MGDHNFTLLDVIKETVRLTRARKTCFLVVLSTYTLALLASQGLGNYFFYMARSSDSRLVSTNETDIAACMQAIIEPWMTASMMKNLSASQQEEFYQAFKLNCSTFEDPPKGFGKYTFKNGSFTYEVKVNLASYRSTTTYRNLGQTLFALCSLCVLWGVVVIAWMLHDATTNTPSYNNRPLQHRDPKRITTSGHLVGLFRNQFSGKVFRGMIRVFCTYLVLRGLYYTTDSLGANVRMFSVNRIRSPNLQAANSRWVSLDPLLKSLANPLRILFLPCAVVAALEPSVWGFKCLWRGIQLTRGNRWKSFWIYLVLFLWRWSISYVFKAIASEPTEQMTKSLHRLLWGSMTGGGVGVVEDLPELFLLPVFYFLCISLTEKVATMA